MSEEMESQSLHFPTVHSTTSVGFSENNFLNSDLLIYIFQFIEPFYLVSQVKFVCKQWYHLSKLAPFWKKLTVEEFFYEHSKEFSYGVWKSMIETAGKNLEILNFCWKITKELKILNSVWRHCSNVRTLILRGNRGLSFPPEDINSLQKLEHLDVSGCVFNAKYDLPKSLKSIKGGWVYESTGINSTFFVNSLGNLGELTELEELSIPGCIHISNSDLIKATKSFNLRKLNISYLRISDDGMKQIVSESSQLVDLNIRACLFLSDQAIYTIANYCKHLTRINISCIRATVAALQSLVQNCPLITDLDMCYCKPLIEEDPNSVALFVLSTANKLNLEMIGLGGFPLNDSIIQQLVKCSPNLKRLGIGGIRQLTSDSILAIASYCPKLEDLNAHQLPLIDHTCVRTLIHSCPKLKILSLVGCNQEVGKLSMEDLTKEDW